MIFHQFVFEEFVSSRPVVLRVGSGASSLQITWELVGNANSHQAPPQLLTLMLWDRTLGICSNKPPGDPALC